jgi:hypothetical protein
MTTKNQKQSGWKKYLMWVAIVFGVIIVYSAIVGDDEGSSDTNTSKGTGKFGVGKWKATYVHPDFREKTVELTLFKDGTAIRVVDGAGANYKGYWKKKKTSELDVVYEWIEVFNLNVDLNGTAYVQTLGISFPDRVREGKPHYRFTRIE